MSILTDDMLLERVTPQQLTWPRITESLRHSQTAETQHSNQQDDQLPPHTASKNVPSRELFAVNRPAHLLS